MLKVLNRGVTLDMTGYAPAYTEKGSFSHDVIDVFCKKDIFFAANRTLEVPE